jgi:hypothetical protein
MTMGISRSWPVRIAAGIAIGFGALTVLSGGAVLFGCQATRAAAGDVVPLVLWFNFLTGFVYVAAGLALGLGSRLAVPLSVGLAVAIAAVFALFGLQVMQGAPFEMRTLGAMTLRLAVWVAIAAVALRAAARPAAAAR